MKSSARRARRSERGGRKPAATRESTGRVSIVAARAGHMGVIVNALTGAGWIPREAPAGGNLRRNQQLLVLRTPSRTVALRVLVYKVTRSSRGREQERRVEITSTYGHGLERVKEFSDVVLGYDPEAGILVGLDPERLSHGGETSNASSFLETGGLKRSGSAPFVILLRQTRIFPEGEYQAFFRPECLGEYLLNISAIHSGAYDLSGVGRARPLATGWSRRPLGSVKALSAHGDKLVLARSDGPPKRLARLTKNALGQVDAGSARRGRQTTPEEFRAILQRQEQNGFLGEQFVFEREKRRLIAAGRPKLAGQVDWVSRRSIGAGYDIGSFEPTTGIPVFIEVKSSERPTRTFETSGNEWARAGELGARYCIHRVTNVRETPTIEVLRDPVKLERLGKLKLSASGWRVRVV